MPVDAACRRPWLHTQWAMAHHRVQSYQPCLLWHIIMSSRLRRSSIGRAQAVPFRLQ